MSLKEFVQKIMKEAVEDVEEEMLNSRHESGKKKV